MFSLPKRYVYEALVIIIFLALCILVAVRYATEKQRLVENILTQEIRATHERLQEISLLTESNRTDSDIARILKECAAQDVYEQAVGRLVSSSPAELEKTKLLFVACGDYFALRKRLMVEKLRFSVSDLGKYVEWHTRVSGENKYEEVLSVWQSMLALEQERADLLSEQVTLQGTIIDGFIGKKTIKEELRRAEEVRQFLEVKYQQVQEAKNREAEVWSRIAPDKEI